MVYRRAAIRLHRARKLSTTSNVRLATSIDEKLRSELRLLHESEPKRWTATTLAVRYGVARENVAAILRLARRRNTLSDVQLESAKALEQAWLELEPRERRAAAARPSLPTQAVETVEAESVEKEDDDDEDDLIGATETADWVRGRIEEGAFETIRRSSFAFIEVGKDLTDKTRAVWLRDGSTGKLRAPSSEERRRLLGQRRIVPE